MRAILVSLTLISGGIAAAGEAPQGPPPAPVRVATAELRALAPVVETPGTVISRLDARMSAEVAGRITSIREVGERVAQGDTLVAIDEVELGLSRQDAQAAIARAEARVRYLTAEVERQSRLAQQNSAARSQLEQSISDRDVAEADLVSARVALARIEDQLRRSRMPAPFSGVVAERLLNVGERAAVGEELIRLVDPEAIEIIVRAPLATVAEVRAGDPIRIWSSHREGSGTARGVVPFGDSRSHMAEVRIAVEGASWRVGESVRAEMPTARPREVLAVPRDALVLRRDGSAVFKVNGEGVAERVAVQVGVGDGDWVEVAGDVAVGDTVIVRGAERLRPGQPVSILADG